MKGLPTLLFLGSFLSACSTQSVPALTTGATMVSTSATVTPSAIASSLPTPSPEAPRPISELHMLDSDHGWGWAPGPDNLRLLMSTSDGGTSWVDRSPKAYSYSDAGSFFLDAETAWLPLFDAQTNSAGLIRTTDSGSSWTLITAAGGPDERYHFNNTKDGWARDYQGGAGNAWYRFFETHDGGATWSSVLIATPHPDANMPPGTIHICGICGDTVSYYPPAEVIITQGDLATDPQGVVRLSISMDLGKTWEDFRLPMPSDQYSGGSVVPYPPVFFGEGKGVMPVYIFQTKDGTTFAYKVLALYFTGNGGEAWAAGPSVAKDVSAIQPVFHVISSTEVIVRCGDNLCSTADAAQTWKTVKPNIDLGVEGSDRQLEQIDFVDSWNGWAVIADHGSFDLYKTIDGGATWRALEK